ncbi:MAG TPA: formyltetrahydrofolate deformylase [Candidatus Thermoplasmatota archaeon]|nr:formyltetrahydrofolate deformylase [Candidatus Thermoplasmatota archaeon]
MPVQASITVTGKDRTGVIAAITNHLFEAGANIEALEEQVTRGRFHMALQASWRGTVDPRALERSLAKVAAGVGMDVKVKWLRHGEKQRMALFVTREPHCLEAILQAAEKGRLKATPVLVLGNRRDLAPIAKAHGIPFKHVPFENRAEAERKTLEILDEHDVDFIVLARFMKILSPDFCWRYRNKIINIHPSLLPAFPGASAYRQAYERGVRVVGVTAHFVTPDLDQGPIIHQDAIRVKVDEPLPSIVARGQKLEAKVLLEAIRLYLRKRLDVHWGRVWQT